MVDILWISCGLQTEHTGEKPKLHCLRKNIKDSFAKKKLSRTVNLYLGINSTRISLSYGCKKRYPLILLVLGKRLKLRACPIAYGRNLIVIFGQKSDSI